MSRKSSNIFSGSSKQSKQFVPKNKYAIDLK